MPVFNREKMVSIAIDSVLAQKYEDFQLICIDDGSSDSTSHILQRYALQDTRVCVITHAKNQGRSAARNTGIEAAVGKWICFLDSDDIYFPNHLVLHKKLIRENSKTTCFATNQLIYGQPKKYPFDATSGKRTVNLNQMIRGNFISLNQISVQREMAPLLTPVSIAFSDDLLYIRRILTKGDILFSNEVTTDVLEHGARSVLTDRIDKIVEDNWNASLAFISDFPNKKINKRIESHTALFCASLSISSGKKDTSRKYLKKALLFKYSYVNSLLYKTILKYGMNKFFKYRDNRKN